MVDDLPSGNEGRAAEYVLGTLPADERRAFEAAMLADPLLVGLVRRLENDLAPLAELTAPITPSPDVWSGIVRAIGAERMRLSPATELDLLRRVRTRWRTTALAASALAASLAGLIAYDRLRDRADPTLLAVVNRDGNLPALVVRVDPARRVVQVRSLAAEAPAEHSLQLWSVAAGQQPRPLGLVPATSGRFDISPALPGMDEGGVIAVSVEPRGGSPTGAPTGPVIYSGQLVPDVP